MKDRDTLGGFPFVFSPEGGKATLIFYHKGDPKKGPNRGLQNPDDPVITIRLSYDDIKKLKKLLQ